MSCGAIRSFVLRWRGCPLPVRETCVLAPRSLRPMPERKHNLPDGYDRLDDQITGDVADSIVIHPRSHGRLYLSGQWSTDSRPPGHRVKVTSTAQTTRASTQSRSSAEAPSATR